MVAVPQKQVKLAQIKPAESDSVWNQILREQDCRCYYCGAAAIKNGDIALNFLRPAGKGGKNERENLVGACQRCRKLKGNKSVEEFRDEISSTEEKEKGDAGFWGEIHKERLIATKVLSEFLRWAKSIVANRDVLIEDEIYESLAYYFCIWEDGRKWGSKEQQECILYTTAISYSQEAFGFSDGLDNDFPRKLWGCMEGITGNIAEFAKAAYPQLVYKTVPECFTNYKEEFGDKEAKTNEFTIVKVEPTFLTPVEYANNNGRGAPIKWMHLFFRSDHEVAIASELEKLGVMFFPNAAVRLTENGIRITREVDFLVCKDGHWGILEVDGSQHRDSRAEDMMRDDAFTDAGVWFIRRYPAAICKQRPERVTQDFVRRLDEYYSRLKEV